MHCFSMPDRLDECLAEGWWISFAGNVTYPKATDLAEAAERVPDDRLLVETDAPYLTPQPVRKERNQPAFVAHTARFVAERRGVAYEELERLVDAQRCHALRVVTGDAPHPAEPAPPAPVRRAPQARPRPELPHRLEHPRGHRARGRAGAATTSCSRSAAGSACSASTWRRAPRTSTSSSSTARSCPRSRTRSTPHPNTTLHVADALDARPRARCDPAPTKVVANLPYGIAASAILRTIEELDGVTRWVAMVQREVGERFAAAPGTPAYGVPSVLAQLACDVRVHRSISRTVFHPVPNVDSVLVVLDRTGPAPPPALRALVRAAFAHRRKALARSLALAPADGPDVRERARAALRRARPPGRRARRAPRARGVPRARGGAALGALQRRLRRRRRRRRRSTSASSSGPTRADGRHELVTRLPADHARRRGRARARPASARRWIASICPGRGGRQPRRRGRCARFRARTGWNGGAGAHRDREADPGRGRDGRRQRRRRRRPAARRPRGGDRATTRCCARSPPGSAPTSPPRCARGAYLATGAGERLDAAARRRRPTACSWSRRAASCSTADVYREADRLGLPRDARRPRRRAARGRRAAAADLPDELFVNDLEPAARALCPEIDDALAAARERRRRPRAGLRHRARRCSACSPTCAARAAAAARCPSATPRPIAVAPWGAML